MYRKSKGMNRTVGAILVVLGIIGLAYGGFAYTAKARIADVGLSEPTRGKTRSVPFPPLAGAIALVGGIAILMTGR